ncbi:BTAD domain-containing putative transcriptional regulator [Streptomyces sp. NPDC052236]|uniref:AfsR/SARP family transcriptional regulator n=1 Tax=Streptomyces sp. NPDC052236 TaxID=3365686 RepID=UPI0037D6E6DA
MGERLCFRILGPLTVTSGDRKVAVGGARQRTTLSLLLLNPGRIVSVDTLVHEVWNGKPPATARTQIAIVIAALRKAFKAQGATEDTIVTAHPGYLLNTEGHYVDSVDFTELITQAELATREQRLEDADRHYTRALALWRGPALTGVSGRVVEEEANRLREHRLNAYDDSTAVQLALGRHYELVPELSSVVREHPLRECTRHHLMLAQYRSGRRAEAMECYRDAREQFIEELGLEPGPDLQELHDLILRDDPSLIPAAAPLPAAVAAPLPDVVVVPSELPPDVPGFTGRERELAVLDGLVVTGAKGGRQTPTVGLITGVAGVGKSGLSVHWAHRAADDFPDGRLFADLRGYDGQHAPVSVSDVLSRFLRSLGVPGTQIPDVLEERIAMYRSLLADRRVLMVLDNVRTFAQLRPLLPGSGRSCVLITSRDQLEQLVTWPQEARIHLGVLPPDEAIELVGKIAGRKRIVAARADAARLVELCDRLPLALRIAAARLASKPHWSLRHLVVRLSDERRRLDELSQGDSQVRAGFELSYRYLSRDVARLYRRLGLLDVPDFTSWVGAALLDMDVLDAELLVEDLVDAQFLEVVGTDTTGRLRYRFQNLLRLYAAERARDEDSAEERRAACERVFRTLLTIAEEGHRREHGGHFSIIHSDVERRPLDPEFMEELLADPLEWFEAERLCLVAVVEQSAALGMAALAWDLTVSSVVLFETRNYVDNWHTCCERALAAARSAGDLLGQAVVLDHMGTAALRLRTLDTAAELLEESLTLFRAVGEDLGRALSLRSLSIVYRMKGELDLVEDCLSEALPIFRAAGDISSEASTLQNMAQLALSQGDAEGALAFGLDSVRVSESMGPRSSRNLAQALYRVGNAQLALERFEAAEETFLRVERLVRAKSDTHGLAHALFGLGQARAAIGGVESAEALFVESRSLAQLAGAPALEGENRLQLGVLLRDLGRDGEARSELRAAEELFTRIGAPPWQEKAARALESLGAEHA